MGTVPRFSAICIFLNVCLAEGYAVAVVRLAVEGSIVWYQDELFDPYTESTGESTMQC